MNAAARFLNQGALSRGWVMSVFFSRFQLTTCVFLVGILCSALSLVYVTNTVRTLNAKIQQAVEEQDKIHLQWSQLLLEKSTLLTQSRVENVAQDRLAMVYPTGQSLVLFERP